jgi:hypothetical protein
VDLTLRDASTLVLCLAAFVGGGAMLFRAGRKRRPAFAVAAVGVMLTGALTLLVFVRDESAIDVNPLITSEAELLGVWSEAHAALELDRNGRYVCRGRSCGQLAARGRWDRSGDFAVHFAPDTNQGVALQAFRIVSYHGRLYMAPAPGNLEQWDPDLRFAQALALNGP